MDGRIEPGRVALRFPRRLERKYQAYYAKHNVGYSQAAFASGIALFALYTYLDYVLAPAMYEQLVVVRLGIMTPLCMLFLAFMFTRTYRMLMQPTLAFICVMVALAVDVINVIAFEYTGDAYFFGVIVTNMYLMTFGRVQWAWAAPTGVLNVIVYELSLLFVDNLSYELLVVSNFFIISSLILGMVACYTMEHMTRREFLRSLQLSNTNEELREHSTTDPLTGLANRRYVLQRLKEESARSGRNGRRYCIAIADADHFKQINDKYGHSCGDEVLKNIAALMKASMRASDMVARWGGEEFLFFFPDTSLAGSRIAVEQLRRRVQEMSVQHEGQRVPVTVTIGLAEATAGEDPEHALRRADEALYEGKHLGRNRTTIAVPVVSRNPLSPESEHEPGCEAEQ